MIFRKEWRRTAKKIDKELTIGMTKKEVQALQKMLSRVLYNVSEP